MKSSFRPTSVRDLDTLRQFLARVFGVDLDAPFLNPELMMWKYWDRRGDWNESRSFVLERDGIILAHAGIWPATFEDANAIVRSGVQMIDWASSKESAGAGLAIVQRLATTFDFIYSIGGSEATRKVLPAFGFTEYAQQWKAVTPLHPVRQIMTHQEHNWKLAPRLVRNWRWARQAASSAAATNWQAKETAPQDIPTEAALRSSLWSVPIPRSRAFFEYLLRCPTVRFRFYQIYEGDECRGHFAISLVRGQARLVGVWLNEPTPGNLTSAFRLARRTAFRLDGAYELVATGSDAGPGRDAVLEAGFRSILGPAVYTLDKKKTLSALPRLQFQFADDDAAFLDKGNASYWS